MKRVVGYTEDGHTIWSDNEPSSGSAEDSTAPRRRPGKARYGDRLLSGQGSAERERWVREAVEGERAARTDVLP